MATERIRAGRKNPPGRANLTGAKWRRPLPGSGNLENLQVFGDVA